jgi:metal-responsive CopG/Arc/MetJ family transcriptional regulator
MGSEGVKRVSADFSQSTYDALKQLANERNESMADALRDAIALSKWFHDVQSRGGKILVEQDGKMREVLKF